MMEQIMEKMYQHYRKAKAIERGFVPYDYDAYEIHVKCAYHYAKNLGLCESDQIVKNIIRMWQSL